MKILSHVVKNGMIRVTTDNPGRPVFVYRADKFGSKAELVAEIKKSIAGEARRKNKKKAKMEKLMGELDARD